MKKILLILAFVLSLFFALSIVSFATDTENTYYVVQSEDSEIAEALRQEGKSVIGASKLYSSRNDSIKEDSTYFLNQFNNSEINLILAENINYKISSTNSPLGAGVRLDKAITMNVYFNNHYWWIPDDVNYAGFFVANEGASLNLIGNRTEAEIKAASYFTSKNIVSATTIPEGVDFYGGFIGIYIQAGDLSIKDAIIVGHDEVVYQKDYGDAQPSGLTTLHFDNCAIYNTTNCYPVVCKSEGRSDMKIELDRFYTEELQVFNVVTDSYIRNSKMSYFYTDSWHADSLIGKEYVYINDSIIGNYTSIGDTLHPVAVNTTFKTIDLRGDSSGGAYITLIDSTYTGLYLIRKQTANASLSNGIVYIVTPADCETDAERMVYTYDDSTSSIISYPDIQYPLLNPKLGHKSNSDAIYISYESYTEKGDGKYICSVCEKEYIAVGVKEPLFNVQGYSAPEDGRGGIAIGFKANLDAVNEYELLTGKKVNYGVFAVAQSKLGDNDIFDANGNPSRGVINADVTEYNFKSFELKIIGFNDEQKDAMLVLGAYVKTTDGDKIEYSYIQSGKPQENEKYAAISYNLVLYPPAYELEIEDVTIEEGTTKALVSSITLDGNEIPLTYSYEGSDISIENYILKGINKNTETLVTVTGDGVIGKFTVRVTENTNYKYVVIIGVDGAGAYFQNANTPNIDEIFANGAITYNCLTSNPTISAQCWGSLLHGVIPSDHGLTNDIVASTPYPIDSKYPSVFRVIRENDENAVLASFCNWNPINYGIIEDGIGVHKVGGLSDANLTNSIVSYLNTNSPTLLFVQFDEADGAGHSTGYGGEAQLNKIAEIDGYIGRIYEMYQQKGILNDTLFIVTADHGGNGTNHGGLTDTEKYVMFAAAGKTVQSGSTIEDMEIRDTASIVLHALGYENPKSWTSRVPSGLFNGVIAGERPVDYGFGRHHINEATPEAGSGDYITNYITDHKLQTYLTVDGSATDTQGGVVTENGTIAYVDNGYFGQGVQLNRGYLSIKNFAPGTDSFTVAFWINTQGVGSNQDPCIIANKNWQSGKNQGLAVALTSGEVRLNFGDGYNRVDCNLSLPSDYKEGWMHIMIIVDRTNNTLSLVIDLKTIKTVSLTGSLQTNSMNTAYDCLNIGQDGTGKYNNSLPAVVDEIMIFEGAFDQNDINSLAEYYGMED